MATTLKRPGIGPAALFLAVMLLFHAPVSMGSTWGDSVTGCSVAER